jgi:hypothetical protein
MNAAQIDTVASAAASPSTRDLGRVKGRAFHEVDSKRIKRQSLGAYQRNACVTYVLYVNGQALGMPSCKGKSTRRVAILHLVQLARFRMPKQPLMIQIKDRDVRAWLGDREMDA